MLSVVDALHSPRSSDLVQRLREEAVGASLLSLERLVRHPLVRGVGADAKASDPREDRVPDYGAGRQQQGFTNVHVLEGGVNAWKLAGYGLVGTGK